MQETLVELLQEEIIEVAGGAGELRLPSILCF